MCKQKPDSIIIVKGRNITLPVNCTQNKFFALSQYEMEWSECEKSVSRIYLSHSSVINTHFLSLSCLISSYICVSSVQLNNNANNNEIFAHLHFFGKLISVTKIRTKLMVL